MARTANAAPMSVVDAARTGDRRTLLEAMRDQLAAQMVTAPDTVVAQIAARLQAVVNDLDAIPVEEKGSVSDDLAARRANRRANATSGAPAAGTGQ